MGSQSTLSFLLGKCRCRNHSQINGKVSKGYWYRQGDVWRTKTANAEHAVSDLLEAAVPALKREATKTKC